MEGWPAWREFDLLDRELGLGSARVKVVKRIVRCAATEVDPDTGIRDLPIPSTLMQSFGHADCGVYAEVIAAGEIARRRSSRSRAELSANCEDLGQAVVGRDAAGRLLHALATLRRLSPGVAAALPACAL